MALHSLPVTTVNEAAPLTATPSKSKAEAAPAAAAANAAAVQAVAAALNDQAAGQNEPVASRQAAASAPANLPVASAVPAPKAREMLYRHGVEMVLQGSYPDMVAYMETLERLPVQLFWGKAQLDAQSYPEAKLTLTLYTLSLDDKWLKL